MVAKPILVYSWTDTKGQILPMQFIVERESGLKETKVDKIITITKEKLADIAMLVYECESEIKGMLWNYQLKYEINTCKWTLFKYSPKAL